MWREAGEPRAKTAAEDASDTGLRKVGADAAQQEYILRYIDGGRGLADYSLMTTLVPMLMYRESSSICSLVSATQPSVQSLLRCR